MTLVLSGSKFTVAGGPTGRGAFGALAARVREHGFIVLPVDGKKPMLRGWRGRPLGDRAIDNLLRRNPQTANANLGLRTGKLVAIDIDHADKDLAWRITQVAMGILGHTPFVRVGRSPKRMLFYRLKAAVPSRAVGKVDILSEGKFAVVSGIHPITGAPYYWPDECMLDAELTDVPLISKDALDIFINAIPHLNKAGGSRTQRTQTAALLDEVVEEALREKRSDRTHLGEYVEGHRNRALFSHIRAEALKGWTPAQLLKSAQSFNADRCRPPLRTQEVERSLGSVLKYRKEGRLFAKGTQQIVLPLSKDDLKSLTPDATHLYAILKATRKKRNFDIPQKATAKTLGWGDKRVKKAIDSLIANGHLHETSRSRANGKCNILYSFPRQI